jgi:post-segregation antitoxin (ccd killing protein)
MAADLRKQSSFWAVRGCLERMFGPRLPYAPILNLVRKIAYDHDLKLSRDISRKRDAAIAWLAANLDLAQPHLGAPHSVEFPQTAAQARVHANTDQIASVEDWLLNIFGHCPVMHELRQKAIEWSATMRTGIDRDARRNRLVLQCWIIENWDAIRAIQEPLADQSDCIEPDPTRDFSAEFPDPFVPEQIDDAAFELTPVEHDFSE